MRLIAHRGNTEGPNEEKENSVPYIREALSKGYDVEVDVTLNKQGTVCLGHDCPMYAIDISFFKNDRIWCHAKSLETFLHLAKFSNINTFFQYGDSIVVTSKGYYWHHADFSLDVDYSDLSVLTILECKPFNFVDKKPFGICTDYPETYQKTYNLYPPTNEDIFKVLILDVDGVLTDGTKLYTGGSVYKSFNDKDFTAIKRFKAAGIKVCLLTGDTNINRDIARSRNIDFYNAREADYNNTIDKSKFVNRIAQEYKVNPQDLAYIGDDYYDLSIIDSLRWTYSPADAIPEVKNRVHKVLKTPGGHGVVAELYTMHEDVIRGAFPYDNL